MTKANDRSGQALRPTSIDAIGRAGVAHGPLGTVTQSLAGVARESAGLLHNIAALGITLVLHAGNTTPKRRPLTRPLAAPIATNIIRFPTNRNANPRK